MREEKYFIINESGEVVRVTKAEYEKWCEENKEEIKLINSVRNDINILNDMSLEELDNVEKAILNRINYVDKRISKLNTDLRMKKMGI